MDEYLRRVFERVFVRRTNACRRTNTCPMFLRGYSSVDEYLPHKPNTKPTNTNTTNTTTYSYPYSFVLVRGVENTTRYIHI